MRAFELLYTLCLWLAPRTFRREYGAEARVAAREATRRAWQGSGLWAAVWVGWLECLDLLWRGAQLRAARLRAVGLSAPRLVALADVLRQDLHQALRQMRRHPGFAVAVVLTLAIGIGGSTAVFAVVNNTLLRPMMLEDVGRLLRLDDVTRGPGGLGSETNVSPLDAEAIRDESTVFDGVAVQDYRLFVLTGEGEPERLRGSGVSAGWGRVLGIRPLLGRTFTAAEQRLGEASGVVLIGWGLWQRRWGGARDVLGRSVQLNGRPRTIVGVLPPGFRFPYESEIWTPIDYDRTDGTSHYLLVFGRLRPRATAVQAQRELDLIAKRLAASYPATNTGWTIHAMPLRDNLVRGYDRTALALLAVVGFLLLVGCANVAGLQLARADARRHEMAIRAALGAGAGRRRTMLFLETLVLAGVGGVLGLLVAVWARPFLGLLVPPVMSVELAQNAIVLDHRVLLFALSATLVAALASGLLPGLRASVANLARPLREGGRGVSGGRSQRARLLVGAEIALTTVLLVGAGAVVLDFLRHQAGPAGFAADEVLTLRVTLPESQYGTPAARIQLTQSLLDAVGTVPGVSRVALTTGNPQLSGWTTDVEPEGAVAPERTGLDVNLRHVTPGFFSTLGIPLGEGRDFAATDAPGDPPVAIVSRRLARRLWPGQDPVGKRLRQGRGESAQPWLTVVGVAGDVRETSEIPFALYEPYAQHAGGRPAWELHLMVRTTGDPARLARAVRESITSVAPDLPVWGVGVLADLRSTGFLLERAGARLGGAFAAFGLLLAAVGVFGIVSYTVSQARRELAVRKALGARSAALAVALLRDALGAAGVGLAVGGAGAWALRRVLGTRIPNLAPETPRLYLTVALLLVLVTLLACVGPARRTARIDPMRVLREQ